MSQRDEVPPIHTAPALFAVARGVRDGLGHRCYYCGAPCAGDVPAESHVKGSFTSRDTIAGGDAVCAGCLAAMDERAEITLPTGEVRHKQKVRCYSWVITASSAIAATKAHREYLLNCCLFPPIAPFVICLSDSGQKHLLYRAVVGRSAVRPTVSLEGEAITYEPSHLSERLALCKRIAAVVGKPGLSEKVGFGELAKIVEYHGSETLPAEWLSVRAHPLTRLAAWFTPSMKECQSEYRERTIAAKPEPRVVQATFGWVG